jgi:glutamate-1-semialdehyde 2,1-aminomutase
VSASYSTDASWARYTHVSEFLACGSSTLSKAPKYPGEEPPLIVRGNGCRVWDLDGNEYIDFANGLGPITLGHAIPEVRDAIVAQLDNGIIFGRPHPLEGEVAEILCDIVPCAERARFLKTGGEAIAACIKIARNATGRKRIIHCGYNGWLNTLAAGSGFQPPGIAAGTPLKGIPPEVSALHSSLPWGETEPWEHAFAQHGDEIAAVVIASSYAQMEQGRTFLPRIRELTQSHGALMVMDEIVTGFRLAMAGAQEYFGFEPDLAVFAKGMANGMPISAYVGRAELLESCRELSISSTFGGETLSLAAVKRVVRFYREHDVIRRLWSAGTRLWGEAQKLFDAHGIPVRIDGLPVCPFLTITGNVEQAALMRAYFRNGLLMYTVPYVNYSHTDSDIDESLERLDRALAQVSAG